MFKKETIWKKEHNTKYYILRWSFGGKKKVVQIQAGPHTSYVTVHELLFLLKTHDKVILLTYQGGFKN